MRIVLISIMVGLFGCGDDSGGGGPYAAIDHIQEAYQTGFCKHLVACGEFPDQATCESANIGAFDFALDPDIVAAVLAGKVVYDGGKMQHCIDTIANATCDRTDEDGRVFDTDCIDVIRGIVPQGGACSLDAECVSQNCMKPQCQTQCCAGMCSGTAPPPIILAQIDQSCAASTSIDTCVAGAYCDPVTSKCLALEPLGTPCTQANQCDYGLSCGGPTLETCEPLPLVGQPCPSGACRDEGVICDQQLMCVPAALPPTMCTGFNDCSSYYTCDLNTNQCTPPPAIGESCASAQRCFDKGAYCDQGTLLCTALRANTMPCQNGGQCASNFCDLTMQICTAPTTCI